MSTILEIRQECQEILDAAKYYEVENKVHTIKNKLESCKL